MKFLKIIVLACSFTAMNSAAAQVAEPSELYNTILRLDEAYFTAYNNCDMEKQSDLLADEIEFYHDQGGLTTSKEDILKGIKENVCGKVTRYLVKESIEVSPIPGYGAVIVGLHKFKNNLEPQDTPSKESRFVGIWKQTGDQWQMTRIISLH